MSELCQTSLLANDVSMDRGTPRGGERSLRAVSMTMLGTSRIQIFMSGCEQVYNCMLNKRAR